MIALQIAKKSGNTMDPAVKLQHGKFLDIFDMLMAIEFSNLEGIVIEDFSVFQNKSKLARLKVVLAIS
ncbi:hypothetical protein DGG96_00870 [Legionella qingyii]|uniref:Uncharacterized protein n=1 Tax=Legionella qingyii TaxID=2184757 RepID=A0A317U864_9GAMM|nr:hypothetical protein [Legionella qingyii]PWY57679.1 hypothetical protein DGG96_00870 [Legionella qingyii]RUR25854.1 hypothetical protein ELY20_01520 [Legionella qingyii]RUR29243.1 hypothetical protein ELY16_00145 [Legionella qingyii]